jgi:hypothetical protein
MAAVGLLAVGDGSIRKKAEEEKTKMMINI